MAHHERNTRRSHYSTRGHELSVGTAGLKVEDRSTLPGQPARRFVEKGSTAALDATLEPAREQSLDGEIVVQPNGSIEFIPKNANLPLAGVAEKSPTTA